jgi:hypothetical protein
MCIFGGPTIPKSIYYLWSGAIDSTGAGERDGVFGEGIMRRIILVSMVAFGLVGQSRAAVLPEPVNGLYYVLGEIDGTETVGFGITGGITTSLPGASAFADAIISSSDLSVDLSLINLQAVSGNCPPPGFLCHNPPVGPKDGGVQITDAVRVISVFFSAGGAPNDFALTFGLSEGLELVPLAQAIPEPSTWAMLLLGFAGIAAAGFRKRRKFELIPCIQSGN